MIINRYIALQIYQGTLLTLLVLVSLRLFFVFINELDDVGRGYYSSLHVVEYVVLLLPGKVVEMMPLAILLGTMLSLGSLAGNSEITAMQAAGLSALQLLRAVVQAALVLAILSFILADWVVPDTETNARNIRVSAISGAAAGFGKKGLWIKDESNILHVRLLMPSGIARDIKIYTLDDQGDLVSMISADSAIPQGEDWRLQNVRESRFENGEVTVHEFEYLTYQGKISDHLLDVLLTEPRQMSSTDLYAYVRFLRQNNLNADVEQLIFWKKILVPFTVIIMCMLAVPFILGSERQSNAGKRLMIGILLGLFYVVTDRLLTQWGIYLNVVPALNALLPGLLFLILAVYLLGKKQA